MSMNVEVILDEVAERHGWDESDRLEAIETYLENQQNTPDPRDEIPEGASDAERIAELCEHIDHQDAAPAFCDFLSEFAEGIALAQAGPLH